MARPKSTAPKKQHLTLTVSSETRAQLDYVSRALGVSISSLVTEWAEKEAIRVAKRRNKLLPPTPDPEQIKLE